MRGPLLYCAEMIDNPGVDLRDLTLNEAEPSARFEPDLLGGVIVMQAEAKVATPDDGWDDRLYRRARENQGEERTRATRVTAIPYYVWANREPGAMRIWLRRD